MLARIQQFTTLMLPLLVALWLAKGWHEGHVLRALAGGALMGGAHAFIFALEFVLLGLLRRRGDPAPRASLRQSVLAWWHEVLAAPRVFCWRQPFRSRIWPNHLPPGGRGRRGVLLVHGYFCNRGLWNDWLERLAIDGVPVVAVNLEPVFGSIDSYSGIVEAGVRELERCTATAPVIVAHSMGGLAVRRWLSEANSSASAPGSRVRHVITIATPHQGTWLARLAWSANARQMRPNSDWLRQLSASEKMGRLERYTCFYSHCDNIVIPTAAATLPGANNRHLEAAAHLEMLERPEPWEELLRLLQDH